MPYVDGPFGAKLYYESLGSGVPIVFVHPPAMGHVAFMKQRPLGRHFRLIFFDMRGNGQSTAGRKKITIELLAKDIKTLLDKLGIRKAVLFGYSSGGSVVLQFALTYPERTLGLILSGAFPHVATFLLKNEFRLGMTAIQMNALPALARVIAAAHFPTTEKQNIACLKKYILRADPDVVCQMYAAGLRYDCAHRLREISVPVLLMYGGREFYIHRYWRSFYGKVKNLDVVFINKATHELPTKCAAECNAIVTKFIQEKILRL